MNIKKPILCLFVTTHKRLELVDYVFSFYNKIKLELSEICDLHLICVGSDGKESEIIAKRNGFEYYEYNNLPLSYKFNYACEQCKKHNPDGVISIGSDDIISIEFFKLYISLIEKKIDFCGILDIFFLLKNELCYWSGYQKYSGRMNEPIGPGKYFSKNLLNKLNWKPWNGKPLNNSLDGLCNQNLKKIKYNSKLLKCSDINGFIIDIKTNTFITHPDKLKFNKIYDVNYIKDLGVDYDKISHLLFERNIIKSIKKKSNLTKTTNKEINKNKIIKQEEPKILNKKPKIKPIETKKTEPPKEEPKTKKPIKVPKIEYKQNDNFNFKKNTSNTIFRIHKDIFKI